MTATITTAVQKFVNALKAAEPTEHAPSWYAALDAANTAFAAEVPATVSSADTLDSLATRNATAADVDFNSHKAINVLAGAAAADAVNLTQLQALTKGGANGVCGTATLSGGTVTVSTTAVKTASLVFLTRVAPGGTLGNLNRGAIVDSTSFVIHSDSATETSTVHWLVINAT